MLELGLDKNKKTTILLLGAHCDDIEIGCGGTLLKLIPLFNDIDLHWIVFSSNEKRAKEALLGAEKFAKSIPSTSIEINQFRNGYFPYVASDIKDYFEQLKHKIDPDLIFTHYSNDKHQDHRVISELTWNTFRNHFILEYEIAKFDGDLSTPNVYVQLSEQLADIKAENIYNVFETQRNKLWFTKNTFLSLMRIRGVECNADEGYAEGFYCRKLVLT